MDREAGPERHLHIEAVTRIFPVTGDIFNDLENLCRLFGNTSIDPEYVDQIQDHLIETNMKRLKLDYTKVVYLELQRMIDVLCWQSTRSISLKQRFAEALQLCASVEEKLFKEAYSTYLYYWHIDQYNQIRHLVIHESGDMFHMLGSGGVELPHDEDEDKDIYFTDQELSWIALEDKLLSL